MGTDDYRTPAQYQFGHSSLASRRLAVLARVYRPSTEAFLRAAPVPDVRRALDLGCGPGHTARLLAEVFPEADVLGLDISPEFLAEAGRANTPRVKYQMCDVDSAAPPPGPPADLAFCRFLLSHLPAPIHVIARWGGALAPSGLLLAEEVQGIHPNQPVFREYLGLVERMLASQGSELYVGPALSEAEDPAGLERCFDRVLSLPVACRDAATMFAMNVPNWKDRPFIRELRSPSEIASLQEELDRLSQAADGEPVLWELRQIAWRRRT